MVWLNREIFVIFVVIIGGGYGLFRMLRTQTLMSAYKVRD